MHSKKPASAMVFGAVAIYGHFCALHGLVVAVLAVGQTVGSISSHSLALEFHLTSWFTCKM